MVAKARGNFSLLTLTVAVIATGGLLALNMDSKGADTGWPYVATTTYSRWKSEGVHVGSTVIYLGKAAVDLLVNAGILTAITVACEYYSRRKARRALLQEAAVTGE